LPAGSNCRSLSSFTCSPHKAFTIHLLLSHPCSRVATEPVIVLPDGVERLGCHEADDLVGFRPQSLDSVGRGNRNGQNEFGGTGARQPLQGRPHGDSGGDAIVDHDGDMPLDVDRPPVRQIVLASALNLLELPLGLFLDVAGRHVKRLMASSFSTTCGWTPSTTAPRPNSAWPGAPILRTKTRSSGARRARATSKATDTPPRGSARTTGFCAA
jgi:hypothetical protein